MMRRTKTPKPPAIPNRPPDEVWDAIPLYFWFTEMVCSVANGDVRPLRVHVGRLQWLSDTDAWFDMGDYGNKLYESWLIERALFQC